MTADEAIAIKPKRTGKVATCWRGEGSFIIIYSKSRKQKTQPPQSWLMIADEAIIATKPKRTGKVAICWRGEGSFIIIYSNKV